jgi:flagellar motor switch protein FliN/FliY
MSNTDTDTNTDPDPDTDTVGYEPEQFDQADGAGADGSDGLNGAAGGGWEADLRRLADVPVELSVEIGRTGMTVGETLDLRSGSIVTLDRLAGEPVDLLVNGTPIARGEVVVVDEQFGLRVTEIVEGEPAAPAALSEQSGADSLEQA